MEPSDTAIEPSLYQGFNMKTANQGADLAGSIFRLYMGGLAIVCWYIATTEPLSMISLAASNNAGTILIWLMLLIGVALIVDVVVNDLLPTNFRWRLAVRHRHMLLSALAFCYVAQLYVAFSSVCSTGLLLYYLLNAGTIMFIAFVDAHQRSKDATCVVTCS